MNLLFFASALSKLIFLQVWLKIAEMKANGHGHFMTIPSCPYRRKRSGGEFAYSTVVIDPRKRLRWTLPSLTQKQLTLTDRTRYPSPTSTHFLPYSSSIHFSNSFKFQIFLQFCTTPIHSSFLIQTLCIFAYLMHANKKCTMGLSKFVSLSACPFSSTTEPPILIQICRGGSL